MRATLLLTTLALATTARAQWQIQDAHTTASLRGIHSLGNSIAWASGTEGTVLRTEDNGKTWQHCATPPDAEKLDFRGIQAFDNKTAIVMSSGTGDLSRLYKTTDGCQTWKLLFTNPDKKGFWDAIQFINIKNGMLIGDPVKGTLYFWKLTIRRHLPSFPIYNTPDGGKTWHRIDDQVLFAMDDKNRNPTESIFAASNSSLLLLPSRSKILFLTGGNQNKLHGLQFEKNIPLLCKSSCFIGRTADSTLASGETAGGFSLATDIGNLTSPIVVVGGDFKHPEISAGTAATCTIQNEGVLSNYKCQEAATLPSGYRSSVAYDASTNTWITVGPNGTDISSDDGRNWHALTPSSTDAPDADKNWNALSLPFVVGPHGRIGILRDGALAPHK